MQILFKSKKFEVKNKFDIFYLNYIFVFLFFFREAEQMKLLYEKLNQASLLGSNRLYNHGIRHYSPLEPRRSNPLDRYQLPE
jgi:hypothetical protein